MPKFVNEKQNDEDIELKSVTNKRKAEVKQAPMVNNSSPVACLENLSEIIIPTLENLFALISPRLTNSKITALMSGVVTSSVTSGITMLQVVLGLLVREKRLIKSKYKYSVTTVYGEIGRFKISGAATSSSIDTRK